ncbi:MAG TPA: DNA adenine methylase [Ktedonobacteraceae bacterium]|nr:DNA adenine methylase [Ktedonobacteraceae bacterium]
MAISYVTGNASPFLKWVGGKTQLLPALLNYVPAHYNTYIEPFVGGGALFFALQPAKAVLADSNPELINCYRVVRDRVEDLITILSTYTYLEEFYYSLRAEVPQDAILRAARFIYLNRTCYNGLYRVNKQGQFNVPFGRYTNPVICDAERLRAASFALRNTELLCANYQETLDTFAKPGDLIYIDPPYHPVSKYSDFKRYTAEFFYKEDQYLLAHSIKKLAQQGCTVLASNSYCDFILEIYQGCEIIEVTARRNINKDPHKRGEVKEVLIVCGHYSTYRQTTRQLALWEASRVFFLASGTP